jgi:AraC-like DNA-binding protein
MHTLKKHTIIPHYSLKEISEEGHSLIEVKETNGGIQQKKDHLFLPHRKDYYFFFLTREGSNRHWIDFISYEIKPGNLYFTVPSQVHLKERNAAVKGILVAFTQEFLGLYQNSAIRELPVLQNPAGCHELPLDTAALHFVDGLMTQMLHEFRTEQGWKSHMLHGYLNILLVYLSRIYSQCFDSTDTAAGARLLVKRMKQLLDEHIHELHQVSDYARLLNVSAGHLNDTIKEHTGKTATTLIQERLMLEARRALFHTSLQVKEIAYQLGFEDAAYFNRLFKKLTGETPAAFRLEAREKYNTIRS